MSRRDEERKAGKAMGIGMSVFVLLFGIFWCIMVASSGAWFMVIFGLFFVGLAAYRLVKMIQLSKKEESHYADPWDRPAEPRDYTENPGSSGCTEDGFCPYCGAESKEGFVFCPKCGRRLS